MDYRDTEKLYDKRKALTAWDYLELSKKREGREMNRRIAFWTIISFIIFLSFVLNCVGN